MSIVDDVVVVAHVVPDDAPRPDARPGRHDAPPVAAPLELVEPNAWRVRRRVRVAMALVALLLVASPFAIVAVHVKIAQQQFELERLRVQQEQAQRRNADLRAEVSALSSGPRIFTEAQQLGLTVPTDVTPVTVPPHAAPPATSAPNALADQPGTKPSSSVDPAP